jgi:hypothetical protein
MNIERWVKNIKGNRVALRHGVPIATVYQTDDEDWSAIWNDTADGPRRLKGKHGSAEEVQEIVEQTERDGIDPEQWYPPDSEWQPRKGGGCYRKLFGSIVSVKQAKSRAWYAAMSGGLLGQGGQPTWFATEDEAVKAVDQLEYGRSCDWEWIRRQ